MSSFSTCCVHSTALHRLSDGLCKAPGCDCTGLEMGEVTVPEREQALARLITESIKGTRWRDLTPLDVARHLIANGVRL